jgi:hypothetical protein
VKNELQIFEARAKLQKKGSRRSWANHMGNPSIILVPRARTKIALATAVVVAAAVPVVWQEYAIARTRLENRDQAAAFEQLLPKPEAGMASVQGDWETRQARKELEDRADLDRLRTEVPALRAQLEEARARGASLAVARAASKNGAQSTPPPGFTPLSEARDVGSTTATAMFQSIGCALAQADTNRVIQLSTLSSEGAQEKMGRELANIATEAAADGLSNIAFRVVREVPLSNGDVAVVTDMWQNGQLGRKAFRARRVGAEWRQVVGDDGNPETVDLGADLNSD